MGSDPRSVHASPVLFPEGSALPALQRGLPEATGPGPGSRWERRRVRVPQPIQRTVAGVDRLLATFWNHPLLFAFLVLAAVGSAVWGFVSFYGPQYARVPWYLWLFVPDSPLALTLWLAAVVALRAGWDRRSGLFGVAAALFVVWAAAINIKVGVWTPWILGYYSDVFFGGPPHRQLFQAFLFVAHLGMVPFGLLLVRKVRALPAIGYLGVLLLLFLWDFMDYFFVGLFLPGSGITVYPLGIPLDPSRLPVNIAVTIGLSLVSAVVVWTGVRLRGPPSPR